MPKRTLPGLGLEAYFDLGENGWNDEFDENFRKLSVLVDGRVLSRTTNLPGSGSDGDVYIVPVGQTNQNQIAIWDGPTGSKAWVYYPASEGWAFYVLDEDKNYQFDGTAWNEFAAAGGGGGGTPAPAEPVPTVYLEVAKNATQSISATTATVVFESVVEDVDTLWDAATNSILIPASLNGKVVLINTQTQTTADLATDYESYLEKSTDGGSTWARLGQSAHGGIHFFGISSVTILDRVSTGDRFRLRVFSGGASTLRADNRNRMTLATLESSVVGGGSGVISELIVADQTSTNGPDGGTSASAAATKGNRIQVDYALSIKQARARSDDPASKTYEFVIAEMTGTTIGTVLGRASVVSAGGDELLTFNFPTPVNVVPGQLYFMGYTDKSGTGTTVLDSAAGEPAMTGAMTLVALGGFIEDNDIQGGEAFTPFGSSYVFMEFTYDLKFGVTTEAAGGATNFLGLTDTPSAFTGQAGNAVIVNEAEDGLEFGAAPSAGGGGSGSSENWAVPWRGATVTMAEQSLDLNAFTVLSWDTQVQDTDNFWDGAAPTVFTIPAGVTKVRCTMALFLNTGALSTATAYAVFRKNGLVGFVGNGIMAVEPGYNNQIQTLISGVIDVVEGDEISVASQFGDATVPVLSTTYFQIEVVEATDRSALSKLHPFFIPGLPAAGATVYQTVFTETTILKTTTPTELYAGVAATASSVFTLARNGVSVGTITVPAAGQTGTVSVGANVTFNAGDRLSVIAPGTQDATLADVAITLALQLTS